MESTQATSSDALAARYAALTFPPDPEVLAVLCAATIDALRDAEETIRHQRVGQVMARRVGIALGTIMARYHISEEQAALMLQIHGAGLNPAMRRQAERIMDGFD